MNKSYTYQGKLYFVHGVAVIDPIDLDTAIYAIATDVETLDEVRIFKSREGKMILKKPVKKTHSSEMTYFISENVHNPGEFWIMTDEMAKFLSIQ